MTRNHENQLDAGEELPPASPAADDAEKYDFGAKVRPLTGWQLAMVFALGVLYSAFHLAVLNILPMDEWVFRAIHVNMAAVIAFTVYSTFGRSERSRAPWWDLALGAIAIACTAYIWWQLDGLIVRTGVLMTTWDVIIATAGIFIVIEFARRSAGLALPNPRHGLSVLRRCRSLASWRALPQGLRLR